MYFTVFSSESCSYKNDSEFVQGHILENDYFLNH